MLGKTPMSKNPKKDVNVPELLTLSEACELLKVHPNTLRQWDKKVCCQQLELVQSEYVDIAKKTSSRCWMKKYD